MTLCSLAKTIAIVGLLSLSAGMCQTKVVGTTSDGMTIVKPSPKQIESAARDIVCRSFPPQTHAYPNDTRETALQVERFMAARKTYGCK